ncbi:hypothetical protein IHV25_06060 [Phaeovibrio sulfidiphilus]|uniref:Uncharacterized protein n=1 Tax=Phaeovibrio sulfidiphilus TaxID=1220600 RepID=A0A8J6YM39_9PROT|nr:hypothetical protein [Phaeovibrio sulfidiphilus]
MVDGGIGLPIQRQLDFKAGPEVGALLFGRERVIGGRIEVKMVKRLFGAAMCPQGLKLPPLGVKVALGDEAARRAKANFFVVVSAKQVPNQGGTARASGCAGQCHQASPSLSQCSMSTT